MGKNVESVKGVSDNASDVDLFDIGPYTNGLSEFIATCKCPMTVAIQGDWGTGKTSMMQRIKKDKALSNCVTVDLNTWEYSQFELGNNLPVVFYTALIEKMGGKKASSELKENVGNAVKGVLLFGLSMAEKSVSGGLLSLLSGAAKAGAEDWKLGKADKTLVEATDALKKNFEKVLQSRLDADKKDRMIIFIDDLDRIEPKRAVELMEILKVLLEVDKCVFVLAIDYDVVVRGIKAKYGADMDERKARSFFDKIIQVPFSLPVGSYNIEHYVTNLLSNVNGSGKKNGLMEEKKGTKEGEKIIAAREDTIELIRTSVGCNPRAIKRLINSFTLLSLIDEAQKKANKFGNDNADHAEENETSEAEEMILFATLCLQLSFGRIYDYLLSIRDKKDYVDDLFDLMTNLNIGDVKNKEIYKTVKDARAKDGLRLEQFSDAELYQLNEFFDRFADILSAGGDDNTEEQDKKYSLPADSYELLKKTLRFSSSTGIEQEGVEESEKLPAKILHIYRVVEQVLKYKKDLAEATRYVAANTIVSGKTISYSAVSDKYTRQFGGIGTKEFERILEDYRHGGEELIERMKQYNQAKYHDLIDKEFAKLKEYRTF